MNTQLIIPDRLRKDAKVPAKRLSDVGVKPARTSKHEPNKRKRSAEAKAKHKRRTAKASRRRNRKH